MDSLRFGRVVRALRRRLALTQREAARRSGGSQDLLSRIERGRIDGVTVGRLRRVLAVFDAEMVLYVRWRGGEVDRLVDRGHAALAERAAALLERLGWIVQPEVSYSEYGERGSIDLLAWHVVTRTLLVIEIKTELTSVEETLRRHDAKTRLAAKVGRDRFGWLAARTARLLVLPEERTPRRHVEKHARLFHRAYPLRSWTLRRWLAGPRLSVAAAGAPESDVHHLVSGGAAAGGLLFLPSNDEVRHRRVGRGASATPGARAALG